MSVYKRIRRLSDDTKSLNPALNTVRYRYQDTFHPTPPPCRLVYKFTGTYCMVSLQHPAVVDLT